MENNHFKKVNHYINLRLDNKLFNGNINSKKYNNINLLETENDSINGGCNNDMLKLKIKDFIVSSKESFNEENKFNNKMQKIIQKLRIFNEEDSNIGKKLKMPKINDNLNHNCCFTLKKIDNTIKYRNNSRKNYTQINKDKIKINNKSLVINNSNYIDKFDNIIKRNIHNFPLIKLNKKLTNNVYKRNDINRENIFRKITKDNIINNKNWSNDKSQKIIFIENYLNKRDFPNINNNKSENMLKNNRTIKNQKNNL